MLCSITGSRLVWPAPGAPLAAVAPMRLRKKPGQMVIRTFMAAGDSSSPERPTSWLGTPAPAAAHRETPLLQLAGAKSRNYAPDGTCTRLSVLRIAGYGTAVLP